MMVEYYLIEYTDGLEYRHVASMLGGYDSPDHNRYGVVFSFPLSEWIRLGEYLSMVDGLIEMEALRFRN